MKNDIIGLIMIFKALTKQENVKKKAMIIPK